MATVRLTIKVDAEGNVTAIDTGGKALDNLEKSGQGAERQLERIRLAQDRVATGAIAMGAATLVVSYKLAQASSNLFEAQDATRKIFGESADAVLKFGETAASSVGMSNRMAIEAATSYGGLFQTIGKVGPAAAADMSIGIVKLASDWASLKNKRPEDVLEAMRSGLVGEIEPLRNVGMSFSAMDVEVKAAAMGLADATGTITEGAKMQARYALIVEQSGLAQGNFAATADGMANSERSATAAMEDAAAAAGQALAPAMAELYQAAVPVLKGFSWLVKTPLGKWAVLGATALGGLALALGATYKVVMGVRTAAGLLQLALSAQGRAVFWNTKLLQAETGALIQNTGAQNANAGAAARAAGARGIRGGGGAAGMGTAGKIGLGVAGAAGAAYVGYEAGQWAGRQRSPVAQAGGAAGGVLGGAASGALVGSVIPGVGTAVGAVGGAAIGGWASTGPMAYQAGAEVVRGRRLRGEVGRYQQQLMQMSSAERRQALGTAGTRGAGVPAAAPVTNNFIFQGDIYDGQRFEERVSRVAGQVVNGR